MILSGACARCAEHTHVSKSTVQRWFDLFAVQPHRYRHFKLSNDPLFVEKARNIAGLYLNLPDHAVVLCVDEKKQMQALDRTQLMLPMGLGMSKESPTAIFVTVPRRYSRHWTSPPEQSSLSAAAASAPRVPRLFAPHRCQRAQPVRHLSHRRQLCDLRNVTLVTTSQQSRGSRLTSE